MADSPAFDWVCDTLERATPLDRLQARGTLRLALKEAGLEARSATAHQIGVVLRQVLPRELRLRGIEGEMAVCEQIAAALATADLGAGPAAGDSPEEIFRRLAGS